mgnify:CR=1 FL=1
MGQRVIINPNLRITEEFVCEAIPSEELLLMPIMAQYRVEYLWKGIEAILRRESPAFPSKLAPPASNEVIAELEKSIGPLPVELKTSLKIHNGQGETNWVPELSLLPSSTELMEKPEIGSNHAAGLHLIHQRLEAGQFRVDAWGNLVLDPIGV